MSRLSRGDGSALGDLYDRHGRTVFSIAVRMLADRGDAEDLTQDVFTLAWRNARSFDPSRGAVAAWLVVMTRSRALDRLRSRRVRPGPLGEHEDAMMATLADAAPQVDMVAATAQEAVRVREALETLPDDQRDALTLAYFEGLSHSEISERTDTPLGTIKTRIRAGLGRLRQALGVREGGLAR